jgi:hypothetical protein
VLPSYDFLDVLHDVGDGARSPAAAMDAP